MQTQTKNLSLNSPLHLNRNYKTKNLRNQWMIFTTILQAPLTDQVKPEFDNEELELLDAPNEEQYKIGTKIFKIFNDVEYKESVTGYNFDTKLYQILYEDDDTEEMYHNKVKGYHSSTVKLYITQYFKEVYQSRPRSWSSLVVVVEFE